MISQFSFTHDVSGCGEKKEEESIKLFLPPYMYISDGSVWNDIYREFFVKNTHFRCLAFPGSNFQNIVT